MKKIFKRPALLIASIAFVLMFVIVGRQIFWEGEPEAPPTFAVVLSSGGTQRWNAFDQGVRQACNDFGYIKPVINTPAEKADYEGQIQLIDREIANGAQGVVVACEDSEKLLPYLEKISGKTALVTVLNGVQGLPCVEPDYVKMGEKIGEKVSEEGGKNILVIENNTQRNAVSKSTGALLETLEEARANMSILSLEGEEGDETKVLASLLEEIDFDTMIAMDNETLEAALEAKESTSSPVKIYGVGNSDKVIHALDRGMIKGLCFINEFDAGYVSVLQMAEKLGSKRSSLPQEIQFIYVTQEELYNQENERIIFPFY